MSFLDDIWSKPKPATPTPTVKPAAPAPAKLVAVKPSAPSADNSRTTADEEPTAEEIRKVQRYLSKKAGAARSAKKAAQCAINGAKGGRPSKLKQMLAKSTPTA